jgi:exosome complex component RRP4
MSKLLIQNKDIVVPGEILAEGMDYVPSGGVYRDQDKVVAMQVGITNVDGRVIKVIPLNGKYYPKRGDVVIGKVMDMSFSNWYIDIGCAADASLNVRDATEFIDKGADLSQYYSFGDMITAKIGKVVRGVAELTMKGPGLRKLHPGKIIKVVSSKVPRIIGKQGSMVSLIKDKTGCRITVGQNGVVWIQGEAASEFAAAKAVMKINDESYKEGLTDEIGKFLDEEMKKVKGEKK